MNTDHQVVYVHSGRQVHTDHNGKYTQTNRAIGSQIGLSETNERTVSDWPCSRMTGNNPCTYVRTFSNVFSCSAVPSVNISQVIIILCYRFRSRSGKVILLFKLLLATFKIN